MGFLILAGSGGRKWNLRRLHSILSSASSDKSKQAAIDLGCRSTACLPFVTSLVSVLGGICTKLVLCALKSSRYSHGLTYVLLLIIQLTALVVRGPSELHPVFTVSLNGVAIDHEKVKGAVACVKDFVRHPLSTQRSFFSETGISMLHTAVATADAIQNSARIDPWGTIGVEASPVIADLKSCREKILSRMKAMKNTRERWFSAETVVS